MGGEGVANASRNLSGKAEESEMVRINPAGHTLCHPDESAFFCRRQKAPVNPCSLPEVGATGLRQSLRVNLLCKISK